MVPTFEAAPTLEDSDVQRNDEWNGYDDGGMGTMGVLGVLAVVALVLVAAAAIKYLFFDRRR